MPFSTEFLARIQDRLPHAQLVDQHEVVLTFRVPLEFASISKLFWALQELQTELDLDDFSVGVMSLGEVFAYLAKIYK